MADLIALALTHLEEDKYELALEQLVNAWRKTRASEVAEAVDAVDALLRLPAFSEGSGETRTTWTISAKDSKRPGERGPLIHAISNMTTEKIANALEIVEKWDDPRVGTVVIQLLTELRYSGNTSRPFWQQVFNRIAVQRDPRYARLVTTLPQTWKVGPPMQKWLTNRLVEAASFDSASDLSEAETAALGRIREIVRAANATRARSTSGEHAGAASAEALLEAIHANPDDDAARLVYADWLLERGDPRGEFISLQLLPDGEKDRAASKREKELLKAHRKEWLGPIANVVGGDLEFRRGFLAKATVKLKNQHDVEQYGSLSDWRTLEELEWGMPFVRSDQIEWSRWLGPSMCNVQIARGPFIQWILRATKNAQQQEQQSKSKIKPWALRELEPWARGMTAETFKELIASPLLTNLRIIDLRGTTVDPSWLDGVLRPPPEIRLWMEVDSERMTAWFEALRPTTVEAIGVRTWEQALYRFSRERAESSSVSGAFTRLEIEMIPRTKIRSLEPRPEAITSAMTRIRNLRPRSLTHITAKIEVGSKWIDVTDQMIDAAKGALMS